MTAATCSYVLGLTDITPTEKFILLVIADGMGDSFDLDRATRHAAKITLYDLATVADAIATLVYQRGYINYDNGCDRWYIPVPPTPLTHPPVRVSKSAKRNRRKKVRGLAPAIAERDNGWNCHYCGCQLVPTTVSDDDEHYYTKRVMKQYNPDWPNDEELSMFVFINEPYHEAVIEHKIAVSKGGSDELDNLVLACHSCNSKKGVLDYDTFMARLGAES